MIKEWFVNEPNFSGQDVPDTPDSFKGLDGFFKQGCNIYSPKTMGTPILSEPPPSVKKISPQPLPKPKRLQRHFGPNTYVNSSFKPQVSQIFKD